MVWRDINSHPGVISGNRFQRQDAARWGVAVMTVTQSLDACFNNMLRGGEVRLANAKVNDVTPCLVSSAARAKTKAVSCLKGGSACKIDHEYSPDVQGRISAKG